MGNKETPSLKKDVFVNIQPQGISIEQSCILIAGGKVRIKKNYPTPALLCTRHGVFASVLPANRYGCNDIYLTPPPLSVSDPLRKPNPSTHPAGSSLLPSEQEERERMEFYPRENRRESRIVAIWDISGYNGLLSFLESGQGTETLVSFMLHWAAASPQGLLTRELTGTYKSYLSKSFS